MLVGRIYNQYVCIRMEQKFVHAVFNHINIQQLIQFFLGH